RQSRHSFGFFRTQDEGISNIPPKPEREKDFSSTLKTYLTKKRNRSQRDQTTSREVRASTVEAFTINGLKEEIRQREATLEALNKRIKGIESERDRAQVGLEEAQVQLKERSHEVRDLKALLPERDEIIEQLTEIVNKMRREKENFQVELDKTKSELKVREGEIRELNFSLLECAHDLQAAKTDLSVTISERDIAFYDIQKQLKEREKLVQTHADQIFSLQQELEAARIDLHSTREELEATQTKYSAEIDATQAMCSAEIEATKAKCTAEIGVIRAKYAAELHATKEEHADELEATKAQLSFFKSQLDSTKAQLSFTKSKLEWAKADLSSIKSLLDTAKSEVFTTNNKLKRTTAELEATKEEVDGYIDMMAYRDGLTSLIISVYQEDIRNEKERTESELEDTQEQLNKIKATHEKEKKANAKTIKQLTNQIQNLTNSQVQEKSKIYQLETDNAKLRKQLEQTKTQATEEIASLQAQVETLLATSKTQEIINETPISTANISTPPESPCNSRPSSDLFNETTNDASSITNGIINGGINTVVTTVANGDWVTVRKRGSKRRGASRNRGGNRGGRRDYSVVQRDLDKVRDHDVNLQSWNRNRVLRTQSDWLFENINKYVRSSS
ncbi:17723_t:CDS:2, partial [Cetraspora pellucida]